jgi:hypothetical protein
MSDDGVTADPGDAPVIDVEYPTSPMVDDTVATEPVTVSACDDRLSVINSPKSGCVPIVADAACPVSPVPRPPVNRDPGAVVAAAPVRLIVALMDDAMAPPVDAVADCANIWVTLAKLNAPIVVALALAEIDVDRASLRAPIEVAAVAPFRALEPACEAVSAPLDVDADAPASAIACAEFNDPEDVATDAPVTAFAVKRTPAPVVAAYPVSTMETAVDARPAVVVPLIPAIGSALDDAVVPAAELAEDG